jgi:hypothetical protein
MQQLNMRKSKIFISNTMIVLGSISSIVTVVSAFISSEAANLVKDNPLINLAVIAIIAISYGSYSVRKKYEVELKLSDRVKANVFFGDIFQYDGITIIPVNDYFDTLVDNNVVSSNTLHGIFIKKFFGGNENNLREQITSGLSNVVPIDTNSNRTIENNKRYPLGTVCEVKNDGKVFYLVALTRFNENHRAEITNSEYQDVLCRLFAFIEQKSQGRKVNIPLIGGGHAGVKFSKQKLLEFLLFSIALSDNLTLINGVNVVLHESVKDEIDLSITEILFKSMED